MMVIRKMILFLVALHLSFSFDCVHDHFTRNVTKHFVNDLTDGRMLQSSNRERLRIFVDYTQVIVGGKTEINLIKRATNITATYFYNTLSVNRLPRLYFPQGQNRLCNSFIIPEIYVTEGTIGDIGVICGNQKRTDAIYVAKSTPCWYLESSKRPIWGMISWNNAFLKYDQEGFQQILFVGLHEMTHILGFSASMYDRFPAGNPLVIDQETSSFYLNSEPIQNAIKKHFNCSDSKGLLLEDQDGTLIASHWEHKQVGFEFMIASNKKGSFMSDFTLALLESTGWYDVNYTYTEPSVWGKNAGCSFLNIDNCNFPEFCKDSSFHCDWDRTAMGRCSTNRFAGTCKTVKYFTNTMCVDENFELKNLNSKMNSFERGGSNSRCFNSDYRETGIQPTKLNNRCYISVCSVTGRFIYILVGSYIVVCLNPNQVIIAPPGLEGSLTCPDNFERQCENKKTCPYHCNKNGACINGQCLCTGSLELTPTCLDVSIFDNPVGSTGGLTLARNNQIGEAFLDDNNEFQTTSTDTSDSGKLIKYSIDSKCMQGTTFDLVFGECLPCNFVFNCDECDDNGCVVCDDGSAPLDGRCTKRR